MISYKSFKHIAIMCVKMSFFILKEIESKPGGTHDL